MNIKNAINELINGIRYEDEYYTQILDKMVINDKKTELFSVNICLEISDFRCIIVDAL